MIRILDLAFKDQDFVYNAVRGRFEWWCMQLMSKGGFVLNSSNNNGIVTEEFVGCGMPNENKKVAAVDWSKSTTADGLQDIEDTVVAASAEGVTIKYVVMRKDRFALLKKQKAVIEKVRGWINQKEKLTISKKVINEYLAAQENTEGVQIVLVSPSTYYSKSMGSCQYLFLGRFAVWRRSAWTYCSRTLCRVQEESFHAEKRLCFYQQVV